MIQSEKRFSGGQLAEPMTATATGELDGLFGGTKSYEEMQIERLQNLKREGLKLAFSSACHKVRFTESMDTAISAYQEKNYFKMGFHLREALSALGPDKRDSDVYRKLSWMAIDYSRETTGQVSYGAALATVVSARASLIRPDEF